VNLGNIYEMNMWLLTLPIFLWSLLAASSWKCFHSSNCKGDALRACKTVHAWRHTTVYLLRIRKRNAIDPLQGFSLCITFPVGRRVLEKI